jgi:hypothetical protein
VKLSKKREGRSDVEISCNFLERLELHLHKLRPIIIAVLSTGALGRYLAAHRAIRHFSVSSHANLKTSRNKAARSKGGANHANLFFLRDRGFDCSLLCFLLPSLCTMDHLDDADWTPLRRRRPPNALDLACALHGLRRRRPQPRSLPKSQFTRFLPFLFECVSSLHKKKLRL